MSVSGDDANAGTEESPFITVSIAAEFLTSGGECIIREGTYHSMIEARWPIPDWSWETRSAISLILVIVIGSGLLQDPGDVMKDKYKS